jgi:hypothetical protein
MSLECSECERDLRGGHDPTCSRYRQPCDSCGEWVKDFANRTTYKITTCDEECNCDCHKAKKDAAQERHRQLVENLIVEVMCGINGNIRITRLKVDNLLQAAFDRVRAETKEEDAKIAEHTPFRAHAESDVDFHSGCVQTRERIAAAIRASKEAKNQTDAS